MRFFHVLQLVYEKGQGGAGRFGGKPHLLKKCLQIVFKVPVVGQTGLGFIVDADFDITKSDFELTGKSRKGTQPATCRQCKGQGVVKTSKKDCLAKGGKIAAKK